MSLPLLRKRERTRLAALPFLAVFCGCVFLHGSADLGSGPRQTLEKFLSLLAAGDCARAYALVDFSAKQHGDATAYRAPLDYPSFQREHGACSDLPSSRAEPNLKFTWYELPRVHRDSRDSATVWYRSLHGDNDLVQLVRRQGKWYIANPIALIR